MFAVTTTKNNTKCDHRSALQQALDRDSVRTQPQEVGLDDGAVGVFENQADPTTPIFRLQESWTYQGWKYTLTPGRYRWYVWPGFGSLSANRYGKLLGSRSFIVIR